MWRGVLVPELMAWTLPSKSLDLCLMNIRSDVKAKACEVNQ